MTCPGGLGAGHCRNLSRLLPPHRQPRHRLHVPPRDLLHPRPQLPDRVRRHDLHHLLPQLRLAATPPSALELPALVAADAPGSPPPSRSPPSLALHVDDPASDHPRIPPRPHPPPRPDRSPRTPSPPPSSGCVISLRQRRAHVLHQREQVHLDPPARRAGDEVDAPCARGAPASSSSSSPSSTSKIGSLA